MSRRLHVPPSIVATATPDPTPGWPSQPIRFGKTSSVRAAADAGELYLYDQIGGGMFGGITSADVARALEALKECAELRVYLNSPGGDFFEGIAIYNLLARCGQHKVVTVDGLAASIASVIALAGDRIVTAENAQWMIHKAKARNVSGDEDDLAAIAERIRGASTMMAETYAKCTGASIEDVRAWMASETWMDAKTAMERGFCHEVGGPPRAAVVLEASWLKDFEKPPAALWSHVVPLPLTDPVPAPTPVVAPPPPPGDQKEKSMKLIAARLGLPETASEAEIIVALAKHQEASHRFETDLAALFALACRQSIPEALGVFQGLKAEAEKVPALTAKLANIEKTQIENERAALIEQGKKDGKLQPALEAWAKEQPIDSLKAFLAAAAPIVTIVGGEQKPTPGAPAPAVTEDYKKIAANIGVDPVKILERMRVPA